MNDILLNALLAFGMLFVLMVPLYIFSRASQRNKALELKRHCEDLAAKESLAIARVEPIGNKAFAFTETGQVLIVLKHASGEESYILNKTLIDSIVILEKTDEGRLLELKLSYQESGRKREILIYKGLRDAASDISALKKISYEIKQFLSS